MKRNLPWFVVLTLAGAALASSSFAQPVRREVLKELHVEEAGGCQRITTTLQFPLTVEGLFPAGHGTLLTVQVLPLDTDHVLPADLVSREALVPTPQPETALQQVTWEGDAADSPQLVYKFSRDVAYTVTHGKDFRSIVVTVHPVTNDPVPCREASDATGGAR